jgi:ParB-like chromosome segregation protein Spo0J
LAPVAACVREQKLELLDGFKRWSAAWQVAGLTTLSVRVLELDERTAKAAILGLNQDQGVTRELEEAWVVQGLVRDDGMTQVEAAHLLGRHKSWVCRRLALLEKLSVAVKEDLRLGLLGPALARQLAAMRRILVARAKPKPILEQLAFLNRDTLDPLLQQDTIHPRPTSDYQYLLSSEEPTDETASQKEREHDDPEANGLPEPT